MIIQTLSLLFILVFIVFYGALGITLVLSGFIRITKSCLCAILKNPARQLPIDSHPILLSRWTCSVPACLFAGLVVFTILGRSTAQADDMAQAEPCVIRVKVVDTQDQPLAKAQLSLTPAGGQDSGSGDTHPLQDRTNAGGEGSVALPAAGIYQLRVEAEGYEPFIKADVQTESGCITILSIRLTPKITVSEDPVVVRAESENSVEQTSHPQAIMTSQVIRTAPLLSRTFDAAIPNVPNVIRAPDGKISIKGGREDQSALLVNEVDATDPATGNFALSIPLESIEQVKVYTNPYLPEYGKFTGGVTKVETKRGGEKWKAEVYDFFPEPRFRNGQLFGFTNFSPRVHLEGPIIKERFYVSQGLEYAVDKQPVRGLASPNNEIIKKVGRSFTQFDYIASANQTLTATVNYSPGTFKHLGLDFFNPQAVSPNRHLTDLTVGIVDRLSLSNGSFVETFFQYKRLESDIEGNGFDPMRITPTVREGNYFHRENRITERLQLRTTDTLSPVMAAGVHRIKIGIDFNYLRNNGSTNHQTVNLARADGTTAQRIEYVTEGDLRTYNSELAAFAQDQWLVRPNLSIDFGFRAEGARATAGLNISPRVATSYAPTKSGNTVVRVAIGLFYDKVPLNALTFTTAPRQQVTTYASNGHTIVDGPRLFENLPAAGPDGKSNHGFDFAAPRNLTYSLQVDRKVGTRTLLKVAYLNSHTDHDLYVSPVKTTQRNAIVLFNNGTSQYRSLEATAHFQFWPNRELTVSYIRSRARGELNSFGSYFGDFPDPVIRPNQFSQLSSDAPNRLLVKGSFKLPYKLTLSPLLDTHTGFPYSLRNANQDFVGQRNSDSTRFPRFLSLDLAVTKEIKLKDKYTAEFTLSIFNTTNHFNPRNVFANVDGRQFGVFFANYHRFYRLDFGFSW